jgi:DNA-binding CsgD family transcriptional regulator
MEINKRELNIIGLYEQGKTYGQIANELGLAKSTIAGYLVKLRENGLIEYRFESLNYGKTRKERIIYEIKSGNNDLRELAMRYHTRVPIITEYYKEVLKSGIAIPFKRKKMPENCDACKYCDVFAYSDWRYGRCLALDKQVNLQHLDRDGSCPLCFNKERIYAISQERMPNGCVYKYCVNPKKSLRIELVKCPFSGVCDKFNPKSYKERPIDCPIRVIEKCEVEINENNDKETE